MLNNIKNIITAAKSESVYTAVTESLCLPDSVTVHTVTSGKELRGSITRKRYDLIIVSTPLSDEFGLDLAALIDDKTDAGIVVLVKGDIADEVRKQLSFTRAMVLGRPAPKAVLYQTAHNALSASLYIKNLKTQHASEVAACTEKLDEQKIIFRAKMFLRETKGFTEEQSHKFLQQAAMSSRCTFKEAALREINTDSRF
ncbi:response regulator [Clostridia bacterium]|nr:response regulator [Clostridia bacterium]